MDLTEVSSWIYNFLKKCLEMRSQNGNLKAYVVNLKENGMSLNLSRSIRPCRILLSNHYQLQVDSPDSRVFMSWR